MNKDNQGEKYDLKLDAMGGFAAGIIGTLIGYPLDLVKTRMQTSNAATVGASEGMLKLGARITRQEGIASLYKGVMPPLLSLSILNTTNFASYNYFRSHPLIKANKGWDLRNGVAGAITGPIGTSHCSNILLFPIFFHLKIVIRDNYHSIIIM